MKTISCKLSDDSRRLEFIGTNLAALETCINWHCVAGFGCKAVGSVLLSSIQDLVIALSDKNVSLKVG